MSIKLILIALGVVLGVAFLLLIFLKFIWRWIALFLLYAFLASIVNMSLGVPSSIVYPQKETFINADKSKAIYRIGWKHSTLQPSKTKPIAVDNKNNSFDVTNIKLMEARPAQLPFPFYRVYALHIFTAFYILALFQLPMVRRKFTKPNFLKPPKDSELLSGLEELKETETVADYDNFIRKYRFRPFTSKEIINKAIKLREEAILRYIEFTEELIEQKKTFYNNRPSYLTRNNDDIETLKFRRDIEEETLHSIIYSFKEMIKNPGKKRALFLNLNFNSKPIWTSGLNTAFGLAMRVYNPQLKLEASSPKQATKKAASFLTKTHKKSKNKEQIKLEEILSEKANINYKNKGSNYLFSEEFLKECIENTPLLERINTGNDNSSAFIKAFTLSNIARYLHYKNKKILETQNKAAKLLDSEYKEVVAASFDQLFTGEKNIFEKIVKNPVSELDIKLQLLVDMSKGGVLYSYKEKNSNLITYKQLFYSCLKHTINIGDKNQSFYNYCPPSENSKSDIAYTSTSLTKNLVTIPKTLLNLDNLIPVDSETYQYLKSSLEKEQNSSINKDNLDTKDNPTLSKTLKEEIKDIVKDETKNQLEDYAQDKLEEYLTPYFQKHFIPFATSAVAFKETVIDDAMLNVMLSGLDITEVFVASASTGIGLFDIDVDIG